MISLLALIPLLLAQTNSGIELKPRRIMPKQPLSSFEPHPDIALGDVQLAVKFRDALKVRCIESGNVRVTGTGSLDAGIAKLPVTFTPWLDIQPKRLEAFQARAASRTRRSQPDLAGIMIAEAEEATLEALVELAKSLQGLKCVEYAEFISATPQITSAKPTATGDLSGYQKWRTSDGLDFDSANSRGALGAGVRFTIVETDWFEQHEDLADPSGVSLIHYEPNQAEFNAIHSSQISHGTAALGIAASQHNGFGLDGGAPDGTFYTYPFVDPSGVPRTATAVCNAFMDSDVGDVVNMSFGQFHQVGSTYGLVPWDVPRPQWDIVQVGSGNGVIICMSAGNGGTFLDPNDPPLVDYYNRGTSGAIVVGGGGPNPQHGRAMISNYGPRVDLHAWASDVVTLGYGDLARGIPISEDHAGYTNTWGGTSSAAAMVSAGALAVQSYAIAQGRAPLDGREMRFLLKSTGELPALPNQQIGEQPDLDAALDELDRGFHRNYCLSSNNVSGTAGSISSSGSSSIANDDLVLNAIGCNPNEPGIFIYGPDRAYTPFGAGHLCIQTYASFAVAYTLADGSATAAFPQSLVGSPFTVIDGSLYNFQFYYRDGGSLNATDALEIVFWP